MTTQEMVNSVKVNLGNRVSGTIGGISVDTVVLDGVSKGLQRVLEKHNPEYHNRIATLALTTSARVYTLPVKDTSNNTIRIKDILVHRCSESTGVNIPLHLMPFKEFMKSTPDYDQNLTGTPCIMAIWEQKLYLNVIPSQAYTLTLYVEVYPNKLTPSDLNIALPIDENWDLAIESYATSHVYLKLQQGQMAALWQARYEEQMSSTPGSSTKKQQHGVNAHGNPTGLTDPLNNPFVTDWN